MTHVRLCMDENTRQQSGKQRFPIIQWLGLLAVLVIASSLRFWRLGTLPPGFYYGEAYEGLQGWRIFTDPTYRPLFLTGNGGVPPLFAYANAVMFGLFQRVGAEAGPVTVRVTAACFGMLGILALYGLAAELHRLDTKKASLSLAFPLFAAASLTVMRWHIHFSRIGIEPILVPLLWAGATWCFLRGWRTGQFVSFVGSGTLLAAAMYAYQSAWMIPLLMIPLVLLLLVQKIAQQGRHWSLPNLRLLMFDLRSRQTIGLLLTVSVAFLFVMPLIGYAWQQPSIVFLRSTQVTLGGTRSTKADTTIWHNVWATAKMFGPFGGPGDQNVRRNIPGTPVLNWWQAIPFYLGVGLAVWRVRCPGYAVPLIGLVGLLLPGVFTTEAPHFHRILGASAPTALFCAIGLDALWQRRPQGLTQVRWIGLLLLVLGGMTATQEYFVRWASLPTLYDKFDGELWDIGKQIIAQPHNAPIYLTPHAMDHPALNFALQTTHHENLTIFDGRHIFPLTAQISSKPELYVVFEDEDFRTRLLLPEVFPTAIVQQAPSGREGQEHARYYLRPANVIPQRPPQHALATTLGDGIALLGYDVQPAKLQAGKILYLQLHWLVQATPRNDWTVFTHLLIKDAQAQKRLVTGYDNRPGAGSLPTTRWQPGWRILDEYQMPLPPNLAAGDYALEIGLYQANGERLPSTATGIALGKITIRH